MVEQEKKNKVESQEDSEHQEDIEDESIDDESEPEKPNDESEPEKPNDESEPEKSSGEDYGMVMCKSCKEDVEPYAVENNRWRCPQCNKYTRSPEMKGKDKETLKEAKPSKDRPYEILSGRNIKFSGNELAQAEMLIESGVAKSFNDLAKKAFNILFLKEKVSEAFGGDKNKMENQEPNPKRTMAQIQDQKLMEAYTKSFDSGNKSDPMMPMLMQMMQMFMDNQNKMQMQTGGGGQNAELIALQREIADMKHQQELAKIVSNTDQTSEGHKAIKEAQIEMEKMRIANEDRRIASDERMRKQELETQKEREEKNQMQWKAMMEKMESKVERITEESKRKGEKTDFDGVEETINKARKVTSLVTGKKDTGAEFAEIAKEAIPKAFEMGSKIMDSQKEQRAMQSQMMQRYPMPEQPQQPQQPQEMPQEAPAYEEPSELPTTKSDISASDRQMSETMSSIYIDPPKEKKE